MKITVSHIWITMSLQGEA